VATQKRVVRSKVPETGGPFNLGVTYGPLLFVSGLPPFREDYALQMREARARGEKPPPYVPEPFDDQVRVVMDHLKQVVEAAGSNMDCLLKVIVWLKDQTRAEAFDRIYRTYFSSAEALPTRTRMQAGRTPMDCELEVEAIGYIPGAGRGASPSRKRAAKKPPRKSARSGKRARR
jgi:2-iminobutanoate/2-iminopropanoate deaminase